MKKLEDFTDSEKIKAFNALYNDLKDAFDELTKYDNSDYFDEKGYLEDMISETLDINQDEWNAASNPNNIP